MMHVTTVRNFGPRVVLKGRIAPGDREILSEEALSLVADLTRVFRPRILSLLDRRRERQARFDGGELPGFLPETREVREGSWKCEPPPPDLLDRRVEITGPPDRKMVINALNSGASVYMADFEDACSPTWANLIEGQKNLRDAVAGTITHEDPATGRLYRLGEKTAVLMARPRGLHLLERHLEVDGEPVPACLFDLALFLFHNSRALLSKGSGPYVYLPKLESHLEARLFREVFLFAERRLGLPSGTIRATVLIETLPAAFEMDEILFELKPHVTGLNFGRWDYMFSFIKTFRSRREAVLPDRSRLSMEQPFLREVARALVRTSHRRGAHAMGGMAAQIPIRNDPEASRAALEKVRADKLREAGDGHDGTWVAHPGLVPVAREVFDAAMPEANQIGRIPGGQPFDPSDLLLAPAGRPTEAGLRLGVRVGLLYLEAWLRGSGSVPIHNLMEDTATAEICRAQVWQWTRHATPLEDGRPVSDRLVRRVVSEELEKIRAEADPKDQNSGRFEEAQALFERVALGEPFEEFLTLPAYEMLEAD